jgi:hypothetical protein
MPHLRKTQEQPIYNSEGKQIVLNAQEKYVAEYWQRKINEVLKQRMTNAVGYEISMTTLTTVIKKVSEQKFYTIPIAKYVPLVVGAAPYATDILLYRAFDLADQFETGYMNMGGQNARQAVVDTAVDALRAKQVNWGKSIGWSIFELQTAMRAGSWDMVASKEKARKTNWDLGLQRIAFLGANGQNGTNGSVFGLLNQAGAVNNTSVITKPLSSMTPLELKAFIGAMLTAYRLNTGRTAYPTNLTIPESDWNGLAAPSSPEFPIKSTIALLQETFREVTMNPNFQVQPVAYADAAVNSLYLPAGSTNYNKQIYTLYNNSEDALVMHVGVDYTSTLANSLDNFYFQNTAYGQHTGVVLLRPLELMYFTY